MKIEFLESGSDDCPMIRMYGNDRAVCQRLREAFEQLASAGVERMSLTDLLGVQQVGGCCLTAKVGRRDEGIVRQDANVFCWVLTQGTWDNVAGLVEPFCQEHAGGYQWLDQTPAGEARVLLSTSGEW